jgi:hypothetical protein
MMLIVSFLILLCSVNSNAGTLAESLEEKTRWDPWQNSRDYSNQMILVRKAARAQALQRMQKIINAVSSYFPSISFWNYEC